MCAYTEKVRLAFKAKEVEFQNVEMDLRKKAEWHTKLNAGLIPVMELQDGTLLHESRVLMDLANDLGGDKGLTLYEKDYKKVA